MEVRQGDINKEECETTEKRSQAAEFVSHTQLCVFVDIIGPLLHFFWFEEGVEEGDLKETLFGVERGAVNRPAVRVNLDRNT